MDSAKSGPGWEGMSQPNEELRQLAERANAVVDHGLETLQEEEGKCKQAGCMVAVAAWVLGMLVQCRDVKLDCLALVVALPAGTRDPIGTATSTAVELAGEKDPEAHTRTDSQALGPDALRLVKDRIQVDYS
jgi:hypothetical protein